MYEGVQLSMGSRHSFVGPIYEVEGCVDERGDGTLNVGWSTTRGTSEVQGAVGLVVGRLPNRDGLWVMQVRAVRNGNWVYTDLTQDKFAFDGL